MTSLSARTGFLGAVLLGALLTATACGPADEAPSCDEPCPSNSFCEIESGLCIAKPDTDDSIANLSPYFDAYMSEGRFHVVVFDRLWGRFLYGEQATPGASLSWETIAALPDEDPLFMPRIKLLQSAGEPKVLMEMGAGALYLAGPTSGGWLLEELFTLPSPLTHLHAFWDPEAGAHVCAGDGDGKLLYASSLDQVPFDPAPVELADELGAPAAPCVVALLGGKKTIFSGARPAGLLSISWKQESGWTATVIDEDAVVAALAHQHTAYGLVIAYLDAATGSLKYATSESGQVSVFIADPGAALPASGEPLLPFGLSLAADSGSGKVYLSYHNRIENILYVRDLEATGTWGSLTEHPSTALFFPALGIDQAGSPAVAAVQFSPPGTLDAGSFRILSVL